MQQSTLAFVTTRRMPITSSRGFSSRPTENALDRRFSRWMSENPDLKSQRSALMPNDGMSRLMYFKPDGSSIIRHRRRLKRDKCVIRGRTVMFTATMERRDQRPDSKSERSTKGRAMMLTLEIQPE